MNAVRHPPRLSIADYLSGERDGGQRHEYAGGETFAMAGGSERHNLLAVRLLLALEPLRAAAHCRSYVADMKLRVADAFYYPDVMVVCAPDDTDPYYKTAPCLVIEILSPGTERHDRGAKLKAYLALPSLKGYPLLDQDAPVAELYRRQSEGWSYERYSDADEIALDCPAGALGLAALYADLPPVERDAATS